ncbi:MAG TPA: hypothetical protein VGK53_22960 [Propionicimonas sp.]|jgi:hypothetical protein
MGIHTDEIGELHSTLRAIGRLPELLCSIAELRDEAASKGDVNLVALWSWLTRQVIEGARRPRTATREPRLLHSRDGRN